MSKSAELRGGLEQSAAEHRAILAAIDDSDAELAARLLEEQSRCPARPAAADRTLDLRGRGRPDQPQDEEWRADG